MLFDEGEIVYIGQSGDIYRRIYEHSSGKAKGDKKKFDAWEYFEVENEKDRLIAEKVLIRALKPKYNIDLSCQFQKRFTEPISETEKTANRLKAFANEYQKYVNSMNTSDVDRLFSMPNGTFYRLVSDGTIDKEQAYDIGIWHEKRIKNECVLSLAKQFLLKGGNKPS